MKNLTFGEVIIGLKQGKKFARKNWNGKEMWINLQVPDEHSKMQRPYMYIKPVDGKLVPWLPSQTDILSEDWFEVK